MGANSGGRGLKSQNVYHADICPPNGQGKSPGKPLTSVSRCMPSTWKIRTRKFPLLCRSMHPVLNDVHEYNAVLMGCVIRQEPWQAPKYRASVDRGKLWALADRCRQNVLKGCELSCVVACSMLAIAKCTVRYCFMSSEVSSRLLTQRLLQCSAHVFRADSAALLLNSFEAI